MGCWVSLSFSVHEAMREYYGPFTFRVFSEGAFYPTYALVRNEFAIAPAIGRGNLGFLSRSLFAPIIYVRTKLRETVYICGKLIPKAAWLIHSAHHRHQGTATALGISNDTIRMLR